MTTTLARGNKHSCTGCATKFYDMGALPAACPRCGQKVLVLVKAPRRRRTAGD